METETSSEQPIRDCLTEKARLNAKLEEATRELNALAYAVSHDLKAPLRAIGALASWIVEDEGPRLSEQGKEQLQTLENRVQRMDQMIEAILEYSRLGQPEEHRDTLPLETLVLAVIPALSPPPHIQISIVTPLPTVTGDRFRWRHIFLSLIDNAIRFNDKPEGIVRIACQEENSFWKFSVSDNGPGIEEKYFDKIFRLFQTLVPRDQNKSNGTGLTLAKRIVEGYGGSIWVESQPGQGSVFYFTIPRSA